MRQVINPQLQFGQVDISTIKFNPKSRDDIPKILRGLQYIYVTPNLRGPIFALLEKEVAPNVNKCNGRPGMELWMILVLGVLRLDLNCDYDRLQELVNNHKVIRQMIGHSDFYDTTEYHLQTLKDNVGLLNEALLEQINKIIVTGGHELVKKKSAEPVLHGRCDSFVVKTNVHYPTDINLLFDAMRKSIELCALLCEEYDVSDLRQYAYNIRCLKQAMREAQQTRRGKKTNSETEQKIKKTHQKYLALAEVNLCKIERALCKLESLPLSITDTLIIKEIRSFITHAIRQIDQTGRRILHGEVIPHHEKIFSVFEPYTEWISKGKAGVPVELGLRVCVLEDQYQFILQHRVMIKETDDVVAIPMVEQAQAKFPNLISVSFDKGFHSTQNQEILSTRLDLLALPRKGRLSEVAKIHEHSEEFRKARKQHSAVESAINALEVHGLDRCPDHGITRFKQYIALSVVARNLHRIGDILHKIEYKKLMIRRNKICHALNAQLKIAA
jgi:hypothetical protein